MIITLLQALEETGGKYGLATACAAGGLGAAMIVERDTENPQGFGEDMTDKASRFDWKNQMRMGLLWFGLICQTAK